MVMPRALAAYWRKKRHKQLSPRKTVRRLRRLKATRRRGISMARRKGRRGHRSKKGIIFGMTVLDFGQVGYNAVQMGVPAAADAAMRGDFQKAGTTIGNTTSQNIVPIVMGNIMFGLVRKLGGKFAPKTVKRYLL